MLFYLFEGLVRGFHRWAEEKGREQAEIEQEKLWEKLCGRCGGCGVILREPIHETDCPQKFSFQELVDVVYELQDQGLLGGMEADTWTIVKRLGKEHYSTWPQKVRDKLEEEPVSGTITVDKFSLWSFENDLTQGIYEGEGVEQFSDLDKSEQESYRNEARHYLKQDRSQWPLDILDRLEE